MPRYQVWLTPGSLTELEHSCRAHRVPRRILDEEWLGGAPRRSRIHHARARHVLAARVPVRAQGRRIWPGRRIGHRAAVRSR